MKIRTPQVEFKFSIPKLSGRVALFLGLLVLPLYGFAQDFEAERKELSTLLREAQDPKNQDARMAVFNSLGGYKDRALFVSPSDTVEPIDPMIAFQTAFDADTLASQMIEFIRHYEGTVVLPTLKSATEDWLKDYQGQHVLFLGEDFSPGHTFAQLTGVIPEEKLHVLSLSKKIKDIAFESQTGLDTLADYLKQNQISPEAVSKTGLLILDTSLKGKIPRAILKALTSKLPFKEAQNLVLRSDVRYLTQKAPKDRNSLAKEALRIKNSRELSEWLSKETLFSIRPLSVEPPSYLSFLEPHRLIEDRPHALTSSTQFVSDIQTRRLELLRENPDSFTARLESLMGKIANKEMGLLLRGESLPFQFPPPEPFFETQRDKLRVRQTLEDLTKVAEGGYEAMKAWQARPLRGARQALKRIEVTPLLEEEGGGFALKIDGSPQMRLKRLLGEGRNVKVYETERGTALKVLKDAEDAPKQLMMLWAEPLMQEYGIPIAPVLYVHPTGVLLEQELVKGKNLEDRFAYKKKGLPEHLRGQVLEIYEKAKRLAKERDIWLDLKAANFNLRRGPRLVFVDSVPRLNKGYKTYFEHPDGTPLSPEDFLDYFLRFDLMTKKRAPLPGKRLTAIKRAANRLGLPRPSPVAKH